MRYLLARFSQMLVIIVFLSVGLFALLSAMPGNPVDMLIMSNPRVKPEDVVRLKKLRGLDKPWYVQYVNWIWGHHEAILAASVEEIEPVIVDFNQLEKGELQIDLRPYILNKGYHVNFYELESLVKEKKPGIWDSIVRDASVEDANSRNKVDVALERISIQYPKLYSQLRTKINADALNKLKTRGLFGVNADNMTLTAHVKKPGTTRFWFIVENEKGLQTVGSLSVDARSQNQRLLTEDNGFYVRSIPSQIVDKPENFQVDLQEHVYDGTTKKTKLSYKLIDSPGNISEGGRYSHIFKGQGQEAIRFSVTNQKGQVAFGAFSVEKDPIPDRNHFSEGFVFAFVGNKNALGFSNTYKRPVWELLAGPSSVCGDGSVDVKETCDDGNRIDGDGCSSKCQSEQLSTIGRIKSSITGSILSSGRIGNTLQLMIPAILISLLIAIPLGILSAYRQYSWLDYVVNFFAFIGISLPVFWFGIMIIYLFAENWQFFPAGGMQTPGVEDEGLSSVVSDRLEHAVLPTIVLSIAYIGRWLRYMRASMLEILPADYIRTARAKGLSEKVVILKHALRNALIPVVTILALSIPTLFGGAVLTETVFAWPGIGRLEYDAIVNSDYYVAIVVFLISSVLVMLGNLLADLLYVVVDPRMRHN